jgi:histidyl-tRNA synthetase
MKDLLPPEDKIWRRIESAARELFACFGFSELRPPVLEHTGLFARSVGENTDIVEKEMYTFSDRSGESLSMRPEATAGVLRAYIENKLYAVPGPHKFFTIGPMFRYERPQKGRLRQFHQINCEVLDDPGPHSDAEVMIMISQFMKNLGVNNISLLLNSLGCRVCRPAYREKLLAFLKPRQNSLCPDCQRRLDVSPLRVLDCKVQTCREATETAPSLTDAICPQCREHFLRTGRLLALAGVDFQVQPRLVRGLDYYQRTTFELTGGDLGAQNAVAGGGRYDGLIAQLGGPDQPGLGFAMGMERLALLLPPLPENGPLLMAAALGEAAYERLFPLVMTMRGQNRQVDMPAPGKSLKALLRRADKLQAGFAAILGEQELAQEQIIIKNLQTGAQTTIELKDLPSWQDPESV